MTSINATESRPVNEILVLGVSRDSKSKKLRIEGSGVAVDERALLDSLTELAATGATDEITKIPGKSG